MTAPRRDRAAYMREYRARRRESAGANGADGVTTAAPFDFQDIDLASALDEPAAGDPDVVTLPVRLDDGHFAKLARLMRALEAHHGSRVTAPAAMRAALKVAHQNLAGAD